MIEYINRRLLEWAAWSKRRDDGGLGYPSKSHYCNLVHAPSSPEAGRITETSAALEIEAILIGIRQKSEHQWEVANWFYLAGSFTVKRIAQELKCSEVTVYNRLHALHVAVLEALQDNDIAAADRAAQSREVAQSAEKLLSAA